MRLSVSDRLDRVAARVYKLQPQAVDNVRLLQAASALFDVLAAHFPRGQQRGVSMHDEQALEAAAARIAAGQPNDDDAALLAALPRAELRIMGEGPAAFIATVAALPVELSPEEEADMHAFASSTRGLIPSIGRTRRG